MVLKKNGQTSPSILTTSTESRLPPRKPERRTIVNCMGLSMSGSAMDQTTTVMRYCTPWWVYNDTQENWLRWLERVHLQAFLQADYRMLLKCWDSVPQISARKISHNY